ncbi:tyrosinase family protein [Pinirhizobacter soli]|uniref:tyrosinase family protein n=1 Tax=Pinirhizobacter soli TaxID=2786953 RepID=UPI00202A9D4F|nr:tyrosinase family protein [Pinirhizobacter soli]
MARNGKDNCVSRRSFLSRSATMLAAGAILPVLPGVARSGEPRSRSDGIHPQAPSLAVPERRSINGSYASAIAGDMRAAVRAMMALPPEDPRNWYRQAIIHVLDCPHANGWFFPWHRGYLYWFECIARKLTQNPNFALPYWDVTAFPEMSSLFFKEDLLDTSAPGYIHDLDTFHRMFNEPLKTYWQGLNTLQLQQLQRRGFTNFDQFWAQLVFLISRNTSRTLTAANRQLSPAAQDAVSKATLINSLAPQMFFDFGGALVEHHSVMSGEGGLLESQLHNTVHDAVGGYMGDFLSATDPVFWLHHGNIDRIWDVWLERQGLVGQDGPAQWRNEQFLFFCDEDGRAVNGIAGDYVSSAELGYSFQPSAPIEEAPTRPPNAPWPARYACQLESDSLPIDGAVLAKVSPGGAACDAFRNNYQSAVVVELDRPDFPASMRFQIEIRVVGGAPYSFKHCGYATFFGSMGYRSPGQPPHAGSLTIGVSSGLQECLKEAGAGALDLEIALRLRNSGGGASSPPLKVRRISLVSL